MSSYGGIERWRWRDEHSNFHKSVLGIVLLSIVLVPDSFTAVRPDRANVYL